MLSQWFPYWSHGEVIGRPRYGKTSFGVMCHRKHILYDRPMNYLGGGKDDAFDPLVAFIARANPEYKAKFLNFSNPYRVTGYNPFHLPKGRNLSAHVSRMAESVLGNVSGQPISELQNYIHVAEPFIAHLCISQEPIHQAERLFEFSNRKLWATLEVPEQFKSAANAVAETESRNWEFKIGALFRRLRPFVTSDAIRRVLCAPNPVVISDLYDRGISLFVKASPSDELSPEAGRIALGFILSDLLQVGVVNAGRKKIFPTYCDEVQQYAPTSMVDILDTVLSSGLMFTLTHNGKFRDERLQQSIETVGIKVVFGGLNAETRKRLAEDAFPDELNTRWHKEPKIARYTDHYEYEKVSIHEDPDGNISTTTSPTLIPFIQEVEVGHEDYTHEQVLSRLSARFILPPQECYVILRDRSYRFRVPTLKPYLPDSAETLHFMESLPDTISRDEADRLANTFKRSHHAAPKRTGKKPPTLFNAE